MLHLHRALFLSLLIFWCVSFVSSQCVNTSYPFAIAQPATLKSNKTQRLRIAIHGGFFAYDYVVANAIVFELNNRLDMLPDTAIDLYTSSGNTSSQLLQGSLYHIQNNNIQGLISGFTATESRTAQLAAKIHNIPQMSHSSAGYILADKVEYPFFMRTITADSIAMDAIIALFVKFGWKKGIIVYTPDDYGMGYQKLVLAGAPKNVTFFAISVNVTANKIEDVERTVLNIKDAVYRDQYRIFVYYTQNLPGTLVRTALNNSGLVGAEYVSILPPAVSGRYIGPARVNATMNEGCIGLSLPAPSGPVYEDLYNAWLNNPNNPFPQQVRWTSSYMLIDCILTYVKAMDELLKSGTPFADIKGLLYYNTMKSLNFTGTTGQVYFDTNGDRVGNYTIHTMTPYGSYVAGSYSSSQKAFIQTGEFIWGGGTSKVPRDSPYSCPRCLHGKCVEDVGCVCNNGYKGLNCDVKIKSKIPVTVGTSVAGVVMGAALVAGFFVYRKQRSALVKQVAEKQRSNINRADLQIQVRIGRGASGEVFKGTFRGTEVAVKKIITSTVSASVIQEFELEVAIMCGLRHPNIILFMGSCFDAANKEMLLVMEYMSKGSLHDVLHNPKVNLNYDMKLHLAVQAAQGINFLHQSSPPIVHRDMKSHNILLDDKWNARISDFGITKFKESSSTKGSKNNSHEKSIGTIYWSAPETLEGNEATEKSDVYSFGIVLWEIFHREDPYSGRDPVSVAIDVISKDLRPPMAADVPIDMKDLIVACWDQDPAKRPDFQQIMTTLRSISMKNPSYMMSGNMAMRSEAPQGMVYLVNTCVQNAFSLWESKPKGMCTAMQLHNGLMRSNIEMYHGYESKYEFHSFTIAFTTPEDAVNFCIATQIALLHVSWPDSLLSLNSCARVTGGNGELLWNGLRVQMSIYSGVPNCEHDPATDRMTYMGPVVDKAVQLLRGMKRGSIVVSGTIMDELNKKSPKFVQPITTKRCGEVNDTSRGEKAMLHQVIISSLQERDQPTRGGGSPHAIVEVEDMENPLLMSSRSSLSSARSLNWEANSNPNDVNWLVHFEEFDLKESIGKGAMGDYQRASWRSRDVAIKTLVNQKLKEDDVLRLLSDCALMSKMSHANLLQFHALCLDQNHLAVVSEYMPRGNLKAILADTSIPLALSKRLKIAHDIACGMSYLATHNDADMQKHDNLKSNNILLGKEWEVKIADYGQSNLKDIARTMTSVGSVAWTAPELLTGEAESTPKIATYSFGIILWEIITRQIPYANEHPIRVVTKILCGHRPPIPTNCPPAISQLISDCLHSQPEERPSWDVIMSILSSAIANNA